jgi:transcription factor Dp-1
LYYSEKCSTPFELQDDSLADLYYSEKCSTPFELKDDSFVLKAMGLSGKEEIGIDVVQVPDANGCEVEVECSSTPTNHWLHSQQSARPRGFRPPPSAPIPGILKGRVKHEH